MNTASPAAGEQPADVEPAPPDIVMGPTSAQLQIPIPNPDPNSEVDMHDVTSNAKQLENGEKQTAAARRGLMVFGDSGCAQLPMSASLHVLYIAFAAVYNSLTAGGFLGSILLLILVVSGFVLYRFAYRQVAGITDDILSVMHDSLSDHFVATTWFPVLAHYLAYNGYLQQYGEADSLLRCLSGFTCAFTSCDSLFAAGGLDFNSGVTSSQLSTYESFLVRIARSDFSADGTYHSAGLWSTLAFALPDGRYTSAAFDGTNVVIQANDDTTASGSHCTKTYITSESVYPIRSGSATASVCPMSASEHGWWQGEPASSSDVLQWSSVGKQTVQCDILVSLLECLILGYACAHYCAWYSGSSSSNTGSYVPNASMGISWLISGSFAAQWAATIPFGTMISTPTTVDLTYLNKKGIAMAFSADRSQLMVSASQDASTNVVSSVSRLNALSTPSDLITAGAEEVVAAYSSFSSAISTVVAGNVMELNEGSFNMRKEEARTNSFLLSSQPDNATLQLLGVCVLELSSYLDFLPAVSWFCALILMPTVFLLVFILVKATISFLNSHSNLSTATVHPEESVRRKSMMGKLSAGIERGLSSKNLVSPRSKSPRGETRDGKDNILQPKMWFGIHSSVWFFVSIAVFIGVCVLVWCIFNVNTTSASRHALGDLAQTAADTLASNVTRNVIISTSLMTVSNVALEVHYSTRQVSCLSSLLQCQVGLLPLQLGSGYSTAFGAEWAYVLASALAKDTLCDRITFVLYDQAWISKVRASASISYSNRISHDKQYIQVERRSDGSLWAWTGDSEYQQEFSIDSTSYAMTLVSENSTGGRGALLQSESWFKTASNESQFNTDYDEVPTTMLNTGDSAWMQSLSLKGFPPNITADGSSTFLAQGGSTSSYYDSRLYGVWKTELSSQKLGMIMESYLTDTTPNSEVLAFLTDLDGYLIAASSADIRGWIEGNSSLILAENCGNSRAETVVNYFKEEQGTYRAITEQATASYYETYQVKPFSFKNGKFLLWTTGYGSHMKTLISDIDFTCVLLCMAFLLTTGVSVTLIDRLKAFMHLKQVELMFKQLEIEATSASISQSNLVEALAQSQSQECLHAASQGTPRDLMCDTQAVQEDQIVSSHTEKRATRSVDSAVKIVHRLYSAELEKIQKESPTLVLADAQDKAMKALRANTKEDLQLTKNASNIQAKYVLLLEYGPDSYIYRFCAWKLSSQLSKDFSKWALLVWLLFGVLVDRNSTNLSHPIEVVDFVLLWVVTTDAGFTLFTFCTNVIAGLDGRVAAADTARNLIIQSFIVVVCIFDWCAAMWLSGYVRLGLYLRPVMLVMTSRPLRSTIVLLCLALANARVILTVFFLFVLWGTILLMAAFEGKDAYLDLAGGAPAGIGFGSFYNSFISAFVFMLTGENYTDIVYPGIAMSKTYMLLFTGLSVTGLFFLLSLLVADFQDSFESSRGRSIEAREFKKIPGYALVFAMWSFSPGEQRDDFENMSKEEFLGFMEVYWNMIDVQADDEGCSTNIFAGSELWSRDELGSSSGSTFDNKSRWHAGAKVATSDHHIMMKVFEKLDVDRSKSMNVLEFEKNLELSKVMKKVSRSWILSMKLRLMSVEKKLEPLEQRTRSMKQRRKRLKLRNKKDRLERRLELYIRKKLDQDGSQESSVAQWLQMAAKGLSLALMSALCMLGCLNSYSWLEVCVDRTAAVILVAMVIEMVMRVYIAGHYTNSNGETKWSPFRFLSFAPSYDVMLARWIDFTLVLGVVIAEIIVMASYPNDWKRVYRVFMLPLVLRIFTAFEVFRNVISMFMISMKAASDLIVIICCFIYTFAHLGVDLFENKIGESLGKNVNFNTPENALCVLMQMFVGEGWNEILSLTVQQTHASAALYFVAFVMGSVLFTQVFVSVILNMYSRLKAESSISMLDDNYDSFFEMSREDHDTMTQSMMELNETLWKYTADNMRLARDIKRKLLDDDHDDEDSDAEVAPRMPLPELAIPELSARSSAREDPGLLQPSSVTSVSS